MKTFIKVITDFLNEYHITEWIIKLINKVGIKKKLVTGERFRQALNVVKPGDVILVRPYGELTSVLLGEGYTHIALVTSPEAGHIVDSTAIGVASRDILELLIGTRDIAILRPQVPEATKQAAIKQANLYATKHIKYDYAFASNKESMYCSEFVYHCYNDADFMLLGLRERFGKLTITPEDFYKNQRVFKIVYEYKSN